MFFSTSFVLSLSGSSCLWCLLCVLMTFLLTVALLPPFSLPVVLPAWLKPQECQHKSGRPQHNQATLSRAMGYTLLLALSSPADTIISRHHLPTQKHTRLWQHGCTNVLLMYNETFVSVWEFVSLQSHGKPLCSDVLIIFVSSLLINDPSVPSHWCSTSNSLIHTQGCNPTTKCSLQWCNSSNSIKETQNYRHTVSSALKAMYKTIRRVFVAHLSRRSSPLSCCTFGWQTLDDQACLCVCLCVILYGCMCVCS